MERKCKAAKFLAVSKWQEQCITAKHIRTLMHNALSRCTVQQMQCAFSVWLKSAEEAHDVLLLAAEPVSDMRNIIMAIAAAAKHVKMAHSGAEMLVSSSHAMLSAIISDMQASPLRDMTREYMDQDLQALRTNQSALFAKIKKELGKVAEEAHLQEARPAARERQQHAHLNGLRETEREQYRKEKENMLAEMGECQKQSQTWRAMFEATTVREQRLLEEIEQQKVNVQEVEMDRVGIAALVCQKDRELMECLAHADSKSVDRFQEGGEEETREKTRETEKEREKERDRERKEGKKEKERETKAETIQHAEMVELLEDDSNSLRTQRREFDLLTCIRPHLLAEQGTVAKNEGGKERTATGVMGEVKGEDTKAMVLEEMDWHEMHCKSHSLSDSLCRLLLYHVCAMCADLER